MVRTNLKKLHIAKLLGKEIHNDWGRMLFDNPREGVVIGIEVLAFLGGVSRQLTICRSKNRFADLFF
jgi:hypothetical protein